MEELLVYAFLLCEGLASEDSFRKRLDALFLENPEDERLFYLETNTDLKEQIIYIRSHFNYNDYDRELFGKILMEHLSEYYSECADIRKFTDKLCGLWKIIPSDIQQEEPFHAMSYAYEPLCWCPCDEKYSREICEDMLNYYKD